MYAYLCSHNGFHFVFQISLIENVQRADLNPIEEAKAYQQLIREFNLTQEEIAERVAKNRATITNTMRLLKLDEQIQEMLIQGIISSGHARALLSLDGGGLQLKAAKEIIEKSLSVRETERLVKRMAKEAAGEEKKEKFPFFFTRKLLEKKRRKRKRMMP